MFQIPKNDEWHTLYLVFKDEDNEFDAPATVSYRVYCVTTQTLLVDLTSLTPASEISIALTGDLVTIQNTDNKRERRRVCVYAEDSNGRSVTKCIEYEVLNTEDCDCT